MKKFLFAAIAAIALLASCEGDKPKPVCPGETINQIICEEYKSIKDTAPTVKYYETQVVVDTTFEGIFEAKSFMDVYQNGHQCIRAMHYEDSVVFVSTNDFWLEDLGFDPDTLVYSFDAAYQRYLESNVRKPAVLKFVTLRNPVGPKPTNPMYVFGQGKVFVSVDAMTGDVKSID